MAKNEAQLPLNYNRDRRVKKRRLGDTENEQESSSSSIDSKVFNRNCHQKSINDLQGKLHMARELIGEQSIEIRSIRQKMEELERQKEVKNTSQQTENRNETVSLSKTTIPTSGKTFVLRHVFNNVLEMEEDDEEYSEGEEHFGTSWRMKISRKDDHLGFYLLCMKSIHSGKWSIETEKDQKILSATGGKSVSFGGKITFESDEEKNGWGRHKFIKWEELKKDYIKDRRMNAEIHVKINKMTGIYKENLRRFDESMEKLSDVLLIVKDTKFYVLKKYLATHSSFFDALFLGRFQESKKSEIKLSGIDADDFQNYLEVLYCEDAIDETTVEGILLVADMYDTPIVIKKCQKFLNEISGKPLKKKLELSMRYNLEQLKKKFISDIKSAAEIKSVLPEDIEEMDHSIMAELLKKSLEFK